MKLLAISAAVLSACLLTAGCGTTTQTKVLQNLQGCTRVYKGAVSAGLMGGGFTGTVDITCDPITPATTILPLPDS